MKKLSAAIVLAALVAVAFPLGSTALASHSRGSDTGVHDKRPEIKSDVVVRRNDRIRNFAQRMVDRLNAAIARLNKFVTRIDARLDKVTAEGSDTIDAARAKLDEAQTAITAAQTSVNGIMSAVETALASGTPQENFREVIDLVHSARDKVKEAHALLVETIRLIKGMSSAQ